MRVAKPRGAEQRRALLSFLSEFNPRFLFVFKRLGLWMDYYFISLWYERNVFLLDKVHSTSLKNLLDFSYVERTDFFVERTDHFVERSDY